MESIFSAILDDDRAQVSRLLKSDATLAKRTIGEAHLFDAKIHHWMYVGDTALHLAAAGHRVKLVKLLLAAGANPNAMLNHRRSGPLHYAADGCPGSPDWSADDQVETILRLIEAGARINAQDKNGATPLHRAVRTRCAAAVKCLLDHGGDVTLRNLPGSTPFHLAVQNTGRGGSGTDEARAAQLQIIQTFLDHGVSSTAKDAQGKSVLDWARSAEIRDILTKRAS